MLEQKVVDTMTNKVIEMEMKKGGGRGANCELYVITSAFVDKFTLKRYVKGRLYRNVGAKGCCYND